MEGRYNARSPAVKRLMREATELREPTSEYFAQPLSDNLFEWHFTVRGPSDTEFDGGVYHGRIILPTDYPMKPPNIIILTPNGRFETGKKICLSISGHHPESWQPSWSIRTALLAIIGFMPTPGQGTIGSLDYSKEERRRLAAKSKAFTCEDCCSGSEQPVASLLLEPSPPADGEKGGGGIVKEAEEIARQVAFKGEEEVKASDKSPSSGDGPAAAVEEKKPAESDEVRIRKEASRKMQQRFRERLLARTQGLVSQLRKPSARSELQRCVADKPDGSTPSSSGEDAARAGGGDSSHNRSYAVEVLVLLIAMAIAAVVYRRSGTLLLYFLKAAEEDATDSNANNLLG